MPSSSDSHIQALIRLLADDHSDVVETVRAKLVQLGAQAEPYLSRAAESHEDPKVRLEARALLERIRIEAVGREWERTAVLPDNQLNLEEGAFLVAKVSYPDLNPQAYRQQLDELAERIRPHLKPGLKGRDQLGAVNRFLFQNEGFRGNWADYFNPQNSYLNRVIDRKLGIPISLSVLYLLVGQRLKLPIQGVGIPGHFMVKYKDEKTEVYVDPFNEGRFLTRPECVQFIVEAGYPYQVSFLEGIGPREILARMLRNLILIYVDRQEPKLEQALTKFLDVLYPSFGTEGTVEEDEEES